MLKCLGNLVLKCSIIESIPKIMGLKRSSFEDEEDVDDNVVGDIYLKYLLRRAIFYGMTSFEFIHKEMWTNRPIQWNCTVT